LPRGSAIYANGRNKPPILWANGAYITPQQARILLSAQSFKLGAFSDRPTATRVEGHLQSLWMHLKVRHCSLFLRNLTKLVQIGEQRLWRKQELGATRRESDGDQPVSVYITLIPSMFLHLVGHPLQIVSNE
jgi:hypothetical protein